MTSLLTIQILFWYILRRIVQIESVLHYDILTRVILASITNWKKSIPVLLSTFVDVRTASATLTSFEGTFNGMEKRAVHVHIYF